MAYELLVLDVDGTLVNTKKEITERTKEALWECQDQGCLLYTSPSPRDS